MRSILQPNIALLNQLWALKILVWQTVSFKRLLLWPFYLVLLHFLSSLKAHYVASDDPNEVLQSVWVIGVALVLLSALEAYFAFKIPFFKQEAENTEGQFDMRKYLSLGYL